MFGSIFKKKFIKNRADDEILYEYVLEEMEKDIIIKGLWGKALAYSEGDEAKAKSMYMQYRVQSIKDVFTSKQIEYESLSKPAIFKLIEEKILPSTPDYAPLLQKKKVIEHHSTESVNDIDEELYSIVSKELENDKRNEALWLKALQEADGDQDKTMARYTKYRVQELKEEKEKQRREEEKKKEEKKKEEKRQKENEQLRAEDEIKKTYTKLDVFFYPNSYTEEEKKKILGNEYEES